MDYSNKTNQSCVYDAFERAGLPVSESMLNGVLAGNLFLLLEQYGYVVYRKGAIVNLPSDEGFFVLRVVSNETAHVEYHISPEGVAEYQSESISAIAIKARPQLETGQE